MISASLKAQQIVSEVYSDFGGWWTSNVDNISKVTPNNSHNLLGFKVGDKIYSTGVNNKLLKEHNLKYVPLLFKTLPVNSVGAGGIIGLGSAITKPIVNDPVLYLTDGINGLDLCTAMFNWTGSNIYNITSVNPAAIEDGIPDIIIPQVGDPSPDFDKFFFTDSNGAIVGIKKSVQFTGIPSVGKNDWKFYTRTTPPRLGAASAGHRELRIVAFDYADLGITPDNYRKISRFVHQLSGTSDQPFIAYNFSSFVVVNVNIGEFQCQRTRDDVSLRWTTTSELLNNYFVIERSQDGNLWAEIGKLLSKAKSGYSSRELEYIFKDDDPLRGKNYYRLKQISLDGCTEYSQILTIDYSLTNDERFKFYPNPTRDVFEIKGLTKGEVVILSSLHGKILQQRVAEGPALKMDISAYSKGVYLVNIFQQRGVPSGTFKFVKE